MLFLRPRRAGRAQAGPELSGLEGPGRGGVSRESHVVEERVATAGPGWAEGALPVAPFDGAATLWILTTATTVKAKAEEVPTGATVWRGPASGKVCPK